MANKIAKSSKKLQPYKEVTVKSRSYGEHTRAARGSRTPVELNASFKAHVAKTVAVNSVAKRVHDLLKHCGEPFKEAMLWQAMLGRMRKGASDSMMDLLVTLTGMELNSRYPLDRFVHLFPPSAEWGKKICRITVTHNMPPRIKSGDTGYLYEMYLLALGKEPKHDKVMSKRSEWMEKGTDTEEVVFFFAVPQKGKYYVLCLHFMTGKNGKETGTLASRGMKLIGAGNI